MVKEFKRMQTLRGTFAEWSSSPGDLVVPLAGEIATALMEGGSAPNKLRLFGGDGSFAMNAGVPLSIPEVRFVGLDHGVMFFPTSKQAGFQLCWGQEAENFCPNFSVTYPLGAVFSADPIILFQYAEVADVSAIARLTTAAPLASFTCTLLDLSGTPLLVNDSKLNWCAIGTALNPGYEV